MDEFLREINTSVFKKWLTFQEIPDIHLHEENDGFNDIVVVETNYCRGEIIFFDDCIIQMVVKDLLSEKDIFFLHFQMNNIKHAIELYQEMVETIRMRISAPVIKVLLTCTGGFTTGYFADKLNEAAELLDVDQTFDAVAYSKLYEYADEFQVVLLAPQVSYQLPVVQSILSDHKVISIPAKVFAGYDAQAIFSLVDKAFNKQSYQDFGTNEKDDLSLKIKIPAHHEEHILVLCLIRTGAVMRMAYRIYDPDNNILLNQEMIKNTINIADLNDIINTILIRNRKVGRIAISVPGIVHNGRSFSLIQEGINDLDLVALIENKFHIPATLHNDVNTAAVGYYASQSRYQSLSFIFQPVNGNYCGIGSIHQGHLIIGYEHVAGEAQFIPLALSDDVEILGCTPEGTLEIMGQTIAALISINGPEVIILSAKLITSIHDLRKEIEKYIPKRYIPQIYLIDDFKEYMLLGTMIQSIRTKD